ncbi:MAG: phosphate uptake regulator PhoU [DPANN group archaeon]|nr:phosphate uptake regulator PhoU [DPANN group archaeon]
MTIETRKIQATGGGGTYILSLPKKWIKKYNLKRQDDINIFSKDDGALVLLPAIKRENKNIIIDADSMSTRYIIRRMIGTYINGADQINIIGPISREDRRLIRSAAKDMLIGVEISEDQDKISIQCIIDISKLSNRKIFENAYKATNWMYITVFSALYERDSELAKDVIEQDSDVDKLTILAIRLLNLAAKDPSFSECVEIAGCDALNYRALIDHIETMADHCVNIAQAITDIIDKEIPTDLINKIIETSKKVNKIYAEVFYAFWYRKPELANKTIEDATEIETGMLSIENKSKILTDKRITDTADVVGAIAIIIDNIGSILHISKNIGELVIDMEEECK